MNNGLAVTSVVLAAVAYTKIYGSHIQVRVPTNFYHRNTQPNNGKFFTLWIDDYADRGDGSTLFAGLWSNGSGGLI